MEQRKLSILLVEDEENLQDALRLNFEMEGYEVTSAYDGAAALKAVRNEYFDLIILDVMLPEIDGISVCENIRLTNTEIPILILSAKNNSGDRILGLKKGADDYLTKPFDLEELLLELVSLSIKANAYLRKSRLLKNMYLGKTILILNHWNAQMLRVKKSPLLKKKRCCLSCLLKIKTKW